nr:hypothetical protein CFP56_36120 [Quercus suber]
MKQGPSQQDSREVNRCDDPMAKSRADLLGDFVSFYLPIDCILNQIRLHVLVGIVKQEKESQIHVEVFKPIPPVNEIQTFSHQLSLNRPNRQ